MKTFIHRACRLVLALGILLVLGSHSSGAEPKRIDPDGIQGGLVIGGGGKLPDSVWQRFIQLAGGKSARLVLIPTATYDEAFEDRNSFIDEWKEYSLASVTLLHTRSRQEADEQDFGAPLDSATAVWLGGGDQTRIADAYVGTKVEARLMALLQRGGVIGGSSAGAAVQSRVMITGGNPIPGIGIGFDFVPDAVIDQHFLQRDRKPRLLRAIADHPAAFGMGIDEATAVVLRGRQIEVLGSGKVTVCFAKSAGRPAREFELQAGQHADLTELRRTARERSQGKWPATERVAAEVPKGALVLGGGGAMPLAAMKQFIELAGGPDARIVVLPTAMDETMPDGGGSIRLFEKLGAKNVAILAARTLADVERDEYLAAIASARGLWFGGGRQWRFVDAYEGTKAIAAFHDLLQRGGVIGGSSAGASIQAEYLVRGSPLGNLEIMAEGYERGFAFLPGTAVDQHFTQRKRHQDMERLVSTWPQFLGVGIDEDTALVVRGSMAEVFGKHDVWFFDRSTGLADGGAEPRPPIQVPAGMQFDLVRRQRVSSVPGAAEGK